MLATRRAATCAAPGQLRRAVSCQGNGIVGTGAHGEPLPGPGTAAPASPLRRRLGLVGPGRSGSPRRPATPLLPRGWLSAGRQRRIAPRGGPPGCNRPLSMPRRRRMAQVFTQRRCSPSSFLADRTAGVVRAATIQPCAGGVGLGGGPESGGTSVAPSDWPSLSTEGT